MTDDLSIIFEGDPLRKYRRIIELSRTYEGLIELARNSDITATKTLLAYYKYYRRMPKIELERWIANHPAASKDDIETARVEFNRRFSMPPILHSWMIEYWETNENAPVKKPGRPRTSTTDSGDIRRKIEAAFLVAERPEEVSITELRNSSKDSHSPYAELIMERTGLSARTAVDAYYMYQSHIDPESYSQKNKKTSITKNK